MLDFLGIGAQKAGTTWTYHWLAKHPDVSFPLGKEAHFWNRPTLDDLAWYWGHMRQPPGIPALAQKMRFGEITPAYALLTRTRVQLLHSLFPRLRVFFIIRNPIERAWSAAMMALQRADLMLDEVSDQWFMDHFQSAGSLSRGDYLRTIHTWLSIYPQRQFKIIYHDVLVDRPGEALADLAEYLGVDPSFYAQFTEEALANRIAPTTTAAGGYLRSRPQLQRFLGDLYSDRLLALSRRLSLPPDWLPERVPRSRDSELESQRPAHELQQSQSLPSPAEQHATRIAVFVAVLNRGELALASLTSLRRALHGLVADIYLFDNGSAPDTAAKLRLIEPGPPHRLAVIRLPENRGLPYAFNLFCRVIQEPCAFASYSPPELVLIADADVFYKRPISDLVSVLLSDQSYGAVSGHDSIEHPSVAVTKASIKSSAVNVVEKLVERGQCLVLRRQDAMACYPLPHHTNLDLDWQLLKHHPNSIAARGKKVVAIDATVHLGVYNSTWSSKSAPASARQLKEVDAAMMRLGLHADVTSSRRQPSGLQNDHAPQIASRRATDLRVGQKTPATVQCPVIMPRQLLVLGMHRSGTSAIAGLLARLGAHVGASEDLLKNDLANPVGYFERLDVLRLNQQLLARHAADAYQIGHLPLGAANWFDEPDLADEARNLIARLDAQGLWLAKDPRFCLTLPFWRRAGLRAIAAIIVVRDPAEVARSLEARDRLSLPYALALWERYYVEALNNTRGAPRVLVSYNDLMQNPTSTVHRLLTSLRLIGVRMPSVTVSAQLHLDTGLYRNSRSSASSQGAQPSSPQTDLYATLSQATFNSGKLHYMSETSAAILREYPVACDLNTIEDEIRL